VKKVAIKLLQSSYLSRIRWVNYTQFFCKVRLSKIGKWITLDTVNRFMPSVPKNGKLSLTANYKIIQALMG